MSIIICPVNQFIPAWFNTIADKCIADAETRGKLERGHPGATLREAFERQFLLEIDPAGVA